MTNEKVKDSAIETIKKVLKGKIKVTVKPACRHSFKLKCECCGEMVELSMRGKCG